jgi:hypothetical protein
MSRALYCVRHRDTPKVFPVTALQTYFLLAGTRIRACDETEKPNFFYQLR